MGINITVQQLQKGLKEKKYELIDVREIEEVNICAIKDSKHIPMNTIPELISQLSPDKVYAIICHSGMRSLNVTYYLKDKGFNVYNVIGGIDEWARSIDTNIKTY
tara:strand:- start:3551 stop:3865 length:315 start_codon:yes stop_codon:yes gene_type:complete